MQYDPSYDDRGCIIQCKRSYITYSRSFLGIPYERVNFTNLYNCTDGKNTDKYQLNDPSQLIMLCDTVLKHNKIEISLTLRPDINYWGETKHHQRTMISVGHLCFGFSLS